MFLLIVICRCVLNSILIYNLPWKGLIACLYLVEVNLRASKTDSRFDISEVFKLGMLTSDHNFLNTCWTDSCYINQSRLLVFNCSTNRALFIIYGCLNFSIPHKNLIGSSNRPIKLIRFICFNHLALASTSPLRDLLLNYLSFFLSNVLVSFQHLHLHRDIIVVDRWNKDILIYISEFRQSSLLLTNVRLFFLFGLIHLRSRRKKHYSTRIHKHLRVCLSLAEILFLNRTLGILKFCW